MRSLLLASILVLSGCGTTNFSAAGIGLTTGFEGEVFSIGLEVDANQAACFALGWASFADQYCGPMVLVP